jgi:hypothetical protein
MKKNLSILLCAVLLLSISCRKNKTQFDGPSIDEIYSDFKIVDSFKINKDSVNFTNAETAMFSAKFNKIVDWTISIYGTTSKSSAAL